MQEEAMYRHCVEALKGFVHDAGFTEVVLGLSGGIDSALTAAMCVDAFGAPLVHGVLMPGPYSSAHSVDDALELAKNLGIATKTIPIDEAYQSFSLMFEESFGQRMQGLADQNTQARCRMVVLMALSNSFGWLLINTGNKSEAMTGYSTLYGDTAGAFAPLGGVYKSEVYKLSHWYNQNCKAEGHPPAIPENSLSKAPSAELAPGQDDEKALGLSYGELDGILKALVEEGKTPSQVVDAGFSEASVSRVMGKIGGSAFKRRQEPPFPDTPFYAD